MAFSGNPSDRRSVEVTNNNPINLGPIIKSPLDKRAYRAFELSNGMKVLLISTQDLLAQSSNRQSTEQYSNCHLKNVFRFNKAYLGLDTDMTKVRCECQRTITTTADKATSTTSVTAQKILDPLPLIPPTPDKEAMTYTDAMTAIKALIYNPEDANEDNERISALSESSASSESSPPDLTQVASAYLTVGAGWFNDPIEMPGMAHYCEHSAFLGSRKFPAPNQLFRLILPHEGYVNAYTAGAQTVYSIATSLEIFGLALEILADSVGFPKLPQDLVVKEMESLDSEYSLRQDDIPKYFQLLGSLAKEGHPLRKMDSGNRETLRIPNFYRKLVNWRSSHYCSNYMTLVIEAPMSLDDLELIALAHFSDLPSSTLPHPCDRMKWTGEPFDLQKFHKIYHVPSIYHSEFLAIHWDLGPSAWKNLSVKPLDYLSALLSYKGEGGLYYALNYFGWATNVLGGCWEADVTANQFTSIFSIYIDMTEEGFYKQDYILEAVFGYVEMLCRNDPSESHFKEVQRQLADDFHNHAVRATASFAERASIWLQYIPAKFVLVAPQLTSYFDAELIREYTRMMTIETCNIMIFSQKYCKHERMNSFEEFYKTPYASYDFPDGLVEKIERLKSQVAEIFRFPKPNIYLQEITCCGNQQKNIMRNGPLMVIKGKVSLYYKDNAFRTVRGQHPQAKYTFWFQSTSDAKSRKYTKIHMLANYLNEMIESKFSAALSAQHVILSSVSHGRLELSLTGPSNSLPRIIKELFKILSTFEKLLDKTTFKIGKCSYVQGLDNVSLDNRWYAWDILNFLWSNHHQLSSEHKREAEFLEYADFLAFVKSFKKSMYIAGQLSGYITMEQAFHVVQSVSSLIKEYPQEVKHRDLPIHRCPQFPKGESVIRIKSKNPRIHTSVIINGYQFGNLSKGDDDIVNFLAKTMSDAAYYQLRTTEQLGYVVIVYHDVSFSATSLLIELVTQPKNYTTEYCNTRMDQFISDFYTTNLSTEDRFNEFLKGKPKVDFEFKSIQRLYLKSLTPSSNSFRKISIQVVGNALDGLVVAQAADVIQLPADMYGSMLKDPTESAKTSMVTIRPSKMQHEGMQFKRPPPGQFPAKAFYTLSLTEALKFHRNEPQTVPNADQIQKKVIKKKSVAKSTNNKQASCPRKSCSKSKADAKKGQKSENNSRLVSKRIAPFKSNLTVMTLASKRVQDIYSFKNGLDLYPNTNGVDEKDD